MRTEISRKEFKKEELDFSNLEFCYLLSIRNQHPEMWKQFKDFVNFIDNYKNNKEEN